MALPAITVRTITSPTVSSPGLFDTYAYIGTASTGLTGSVYSLSTVDDLESTFGTGELVDCARFALNQSTNGILCVRASSDVVGTITAVTTGSSNTSVGVMTVTGTPVNSFQGLVKIGTSGGLSTGSFAVSLDNGDTYSPQLSLAATYVVPSTGLTLGFTAANYVATDTFAFTTQAPRYTTTSLNTALDVLVNSDYSWQKVHIVGEVKSTDDAASATAAAAIAAATQVKLTSAESGKKFCMAILDGADVANTSVGDAAVTAALVNTVAPRVMFCQGFCELSEQNGIYRRPFAWSASALMRNLPYWQSPHCPIRGNLPGVVSLERNENTRGAMNDNRITSARTIPGANGYFISEPLMLRETASTDFKWSYNLAIMDRAKYLTNQVLLGYLNEQLPVEATQVIEPVTRATIEQNVNTQVGETMKSDGAITEFSCKVSDTEKFGITDTMKIDIQLRIKGTAKFITASLAFQKK